MTERPDIEYPCPWSYRLVGLNEGAMRALVKRLIDPEPYEWVAGHESSGGTYVSFTLTVTVRDEAHRIGLFEALRDDDATRFVL